MSTYLVIHNSTSSCTCSHVDEHLEHSVTKRESQKVDRLTEVAKGIKDNVKGPDPFEVELGFLDS